MEKIRLHWTPGVPEDVLGHLLAELPPLVGRRVALGHPFDLLTEYQNPPAQYQAASLLRRLCPQRPPGELLLALTGADLSAPGLLFIFGEADPNGGGAIISLYRFGPGPAAPPPPRAIYLRRALTEAVHEAGHLLRLDHCPDPGCAMHASDTLPDTDLKGPGVCESCRRKLLH